MPVNQDYYGMFPSRGSSFLIFSDCPIYLLLYVFQVYAKLETVQQCRFQFDEIATCKVQFSSVQDGIYALGRAHMRSTPSLRSFPNVVFETVLMFV